MTRRRGRQDPRLTGILWIPPVLTILGAMVLALLVILGTYYLLVDRIGVDEEPLTQAQLLTAAFATATAAGAVTALVAATRKQALSEQTARQQLTSAFTERFRAAASQLGGEAPAERIAGVYAMAALADDYPGRAQQCVDVLCGYLRLPWDPERDNWAGSSINVTQAFTDGRTVAHHESQSNQPLDRQVRETIVSVMRSRTRPGGGRNAILRGLPVRAYSRRKGGSWSRLNFNFRGARLDEPNFSGSVFAGDSLSFAKAVISGNAQFAGMILYCDYIDFSGVTFSGDANFSGTRICHDRAQTTFAAATFAEQASFSGASFAGSITNFSGATFADAADFSGVRFIGFSVSFTGASFGKRTYFTQAAFISARVSFNHVHVKGAVHYSQALFEDVTVTFDHLSAGEGALIFGLDESSFEGAVTITALGEPFRGWPAPPPEDPQDHARQPSKPHPPS